MCQTLCWVPGSPTGTTVRFLPCKNVLLMRMEDVGIIHCTARQGEESEDYTTCWGRMGTTHQRNP